MNDFLRYISKNLEIVSVALYLIGLLLKSTPRIPHWSIPYILGVIGIISCNMMAGWSIDSTIQGVLVTGAAVLIHELFKQGNQAITNIKGIEASKENCTEPTD